MAQQTINHGTVAGDGTGESPFTGMQKINANFTELYSRMGTAESNINLKAPLNNPTFTGTVNGITKAMVGLGNVDNTSDANKPVSSAQNTAIVAGDNLRLKVSDIYDDFVASGLSTPVPLNSADGVLSAGIAYVSGIRVEKTVAQAAHTYGFSADTYVDISSAGVISYKAVANGAAAPTLDAGSLRLEKVVTNSTPIIISVESIANRITSKEVPMQLYTSPSGGLALVNSAGALVSLSHSSVGNSSSLNTGALTFTEPTLTPFNEMPTGAIYYIDPSAVTNGSGTEASPFNSWANAVAGSTWATDGRGLSFLLKYGTTITEELSPWGNNGISWEQAVRIGAYGNPALGLPVIDAASARPNALLISNKDYWIIENLFLKNGTNTTFSIQNNTTRACKHWRIRNCHTDGGIYGGIVMVNTAYSPTAASDGLIVDSTAINGGQHGIAIVAHADDCHLIRCKASYCGALSSGWGVYQAGYGQTVKDGWTLVSGSTYQRTLTTPPTGNDIHSVWSGQANTGYMLTRAVDVATVQTTPGSFFYDTASKVLTINIAESNDANIGTAVAIIYKPNTNGQIIDCEASFISENYDGVGIGFDRGAEAGGLYGNYSHNNPGYGIQANQTLGIKIRANRVKKCGGGISATSNHGAVQVVHNTVTQLGSSHVPIKAATMPVAEFGCGITLIRNAAVAGVVKNNSITKCSKGLYVSRAVLPDVAGNLVYDTTTEYDGVIPRSGIAVNPELSDFMQPLNIDATRCGVVLGAAFTDANGKGFSVIPTPGAFEV